MCLFHCKKRSEKKTEMKFHLKKEIDKKQIVKQQCKWHTVLLHKAATDTVTTTIAVTAVANDDKC